MSTDVNKGMTQVKIRIMRDAYTKLFYFVEKCDVEIGFMGKVIYNPLQMSYDILSVFVPTQEVTGSTTDLDADSVAKLDADTITEKGHLNAWIHSHVNMGVFWSTTDKDTILEIGKNGLCVAVVVNKKREMRGAIYWKDNSEKTDGFYPTFPTEGWLDDVPLQIIDMVPNSSTWEKELEEKLRKPKAPERIDYSKCDWCIIDKKWVPTGTAKKTYQQEAAEGKGDPTSQTTTHGTTGGGETAIIKYSARWYVNELNTFYDFLRKTVRKEADGKWKLTSKQKQRIDYYHKKITEATEKERKQKQLSLVSPEQLGKDVAKGKHEMRGDTHWSELYSDEDLYDMVYDDLKLELNHHVKTEFITQEEKELILQKWRTCSVRLGSGGC